VAHDQRCCCSFGGLQQRNGWGEGGGYRQWTMVHVEYIPKVLEQEMHPDTEIHFASKHIWTFNVLQARRNRSGRSGPGPTKNWRPCIIIITTTLASCLAATSAVGGTSFLEAKCVNRIPVHCSCADVRISCSCKDGVQFSLSCCCSSYDAG